MRIKFIILVIFSLLILVNCAKPSDPTESDNILKIEKTLSTGGYARDLSVVDEVVFAAEDDQGFSIFNHVSETRLCLVDSINGAHLQNVTSISASLDEDLLFVYSTSGTNSILIFDISDFMNPQYIFYLSGDTADLNKMETYPNPVSGIDIFWSIHNLLKYTTYDNSWSGIDSHVLPGAIEGFDVNGNLIAVAGLQLGFYILDRTSGTILSTTDTPGQALDVKIVDNSVIVALREEGFMIFDITDPADPQEIYSKNLSDLIYTVDAEDNYLVLSSHAGGVFLYDISDIANPEYIGKLGSGDIGFTYNAMLQDGKIFAATRLGIQVITF
ncbi:MAG: hypothetical protein Q7J16_00075 [Candidatus Cloacimonadales bacterium]|nr:hypothetical protein [Candidatus Cloacimonadales bacterium]